MATTNASNGIAVDASTGISLIDTMIFGNAVAGVSMTNTSTVTVYGSFIDFANPNGPVAVDNLLSTMTTGNNTDALVNSVSI